MIVTLLIVIIFALLFPQALRFIFYCFLILLLIGLFMGCKDSNAATIQKYDIKVLEEKVIVPTHLITVKNIINNFGDDSSFTTAQKVRLWDREYNSQCVKWSGKIIDVKDISNGLEVQISSEVKVRKTYLGIRSEEYAKIEIKIYNSNPQEINKFLSTNRGSNITFYATLNNLKYGNINVNIGCTKNEIRGIEEYYKEKEKERHRIIEAEKRREKEEAEKRRILNEKLKKDIKIRYPDISEKELQEQVYWCSIANTESDNAGRIDFAKFKCKGFAKWRRNP